MADADDQFSPNSTVMRSGRKIKKAAGSSRVESMDTSYTATSSYKASAASVTTRRTATLIEQAATVADEEGIGSPVSPRRYQNQPYTLRHALDSPEGLPDDTAFEMGQGTLRLFGLDYEVDDGDDGDTTYWRGYFKNDKYETKETRIKTRTVVETLTIWQRMQARALAILAFFRAFDDEIAEVYLSILQETSSLCCCCLPICCRSLLPLLLLVGSIVFFVLLPPGTFVREQQTMAVVQECPTQAAPVLIDYTEQLSVLQSGIEEQAKRLDGLAAAVSGANQAASAKEEKTCPPPPDPTPALPPETVTVVKAVETPAPQIPEQIVNVLNYLHDSSQRVEAAVAALEKRQDKQKQAFGAAVAGLEDRMRTVQIFVPETLLPVSIVQFECIEEDAESGVSLSRSVLQWARLGFVQSRERILDSSLDKYNCWCFKNVPHDVYLRVHGVADVDGVVVKHTRASGSHVATAPKRVRVYTVECPVDPEEPYHHSSDLENWVGSGVLDPEAVEPTMRITFDEPLKDVRCLRISVVDNWGGDMTCLYYVGVHGKLVLSADNDTPQHSDPLLGKAAMDVDNDKVDDMALDVDME